jgi:periplasmic mercuric ion binding protein
MKTKILILFIILVGISSTSVLAQSKKSVKTSFKVYGNCGMCKERIETALDRSGIKMASWDSKTKMLGVVYNSKKISEQKINDIIAYVGHDTDKAKANTEVYAKLPFCCLYRDHDHSGIKDDKDSHNGHH